MKKLVILILCVCVGFALKAQELNATVNVLIPQQVTSPPELFNTMKSTITEFLNGRKW